MPGQLTRSLTFQITAGPTFTVTAGDVREFANLAAQALFTPGNIITQSLVNAYASAFATAYAAGGGDYNAAFRESYRAIVAATTASQQDYAAGSFPKIGNQADPAGYIFTKGPRGEADVPIQIGPLPPIPRPMEMEFPNFQPLDAQLQALAAGTPDNPITQTTAQLDQTPYLTLADQLAAVPRRKDPSPGIGVVKTLRDQMKKFRG